MDAQFSLALSVTPIYIAVLGLLLIPMTLYVGLYRVKNQIDIGDNDDKYLIRRIRSHANFIETVPLAVLLLLTMELLGANHTFLHVLGATLVISRILHFLGLSRLGPFLCRPAGMFGTLIVYLLSSLWILSTFF